MSVRIEGTEVDTHGEGVGEEEAGEKEKEHEKQMWSKRKRESTRY